VIIKSVTRASKLQGENISVVCVNVELKPRHEPADGI